MRDIGTVKLTVVAEVSGRRVELEREHYFYEREGMDNAILNILDKGAEAVVQDWEDIKAGK